MAQRTLANIVTLNDENLADTEISDLLNKAPLLARMHSGQSSNGTKHQYLKETGAPVVGYRSINAGLDIDEGSETQVSIDLEILSANVAVDQKKASAYKRGSAAYIARNGRQNLQEAFYQTERQLILGTAANAAGYGGLSDAYGALASANVIDAGGTGANAPCSAWLIRTSDDEMDLMMVGHGPGDNGMEESVNIEMGDIFEAFDYDGNGRKFPIYGQSIEGWCGFQLGSRFSAFRLANLTTQAGGQLTDEKMSFVEELMPGHKQSDLLWVMNRRSRGQLQRSRQAIDSTGAIGGFPTRSVNGIEIVVVESITNDEAIVT